MVGSDPEQLERLGLRMSASADRLDHIRGEVSALLSHSHWEGGDADDFRYSWSHRLSGLLDAAATAGHEGARRLHDNAQQQRAASEGGTGQPSLGQFAGGAARPGSATPGGGDGRGGFDGTDLLSVGLLLTSLLAYPGDLAENLGRFAGTNWGRMAKGIEGFLGDHPTLGEFNKLLGIAENRLSGVGAALDGKDFFEAEPGSAKKFNAGVDLVFDAAETALKFAVLFPPAAPAAGAGLVITEGVHIAFDVVTLFAPNLPLDIAHGVGEAAKGVEHGVVAAGEAVGHAVDQGVLAAENVISGGFRAVTKLLPF